MSKMAVTGDMRSLAANVDKQVHPYVVDLMRWCVSWLWSAASVLLNRVIAAPSVPSIKAQPYRSPSRAASTGHIHPEPLVQCQVLHDPPIREADFIFVHGLYGSLENTWRQGDWRSKYKLQPNKIPLRRPSSIPDACNSSKCVCNSTKPYRQTNSDLCICAANVKMETQSNLENFDIKDFCDSFVDLEEIDIIDNYEVQANFVRKLFDCETNNRRFSEIIKNSEQRDTIASNVRESISVNYKENTKTNNYEINKVEEIVISKGVGIEYEQCDISTNEKYIQENNADEINLNNKKANSLKDEETKAKSNKTCEIGCGCICDKCYSNCWPKDWLSVDFPNARIISINYTSDPHLWRPIWVKECKRLRLHERAEQMTSQLLELGVGEKPVVWVGHSKGGLFIKQIYAEAYEAYLKTNNPIRDENFNENTQVNNEIIEKYSSMTTIDSEFKNQKKYNEKKSTDMNLNEVELTENESVHFNHTIENPNNTDINNIDVINSKLARTKGNIVINDLHELQFINVHNNDVTNTRLVNIDIKTESINKLSEEIDKIELKKDLIETEDIEKLQKVANLWSNSAGFMFYSVPHRGSPLADIKTPITARSVELLEISKDCSLVLTLQERWLRATQPHQPAVRSLVETNRTLMAVLWLRIVSVESADAGIGALCGVSVDHREICKPSSRSCVLYSELLKLIHAGLGSLCQENKQCL